MRRAFLGVLPVFLASLYACGIGMFWAITRLASPGSPSALGDPGAYITAGMLGVAVMVSLGLLLGAQERRIGVLEQRLKDLDAKANQAPTPDPARS
jgi:hypothetical protein